MKNDLILMTFSQQDTARKVLQILDILRDGITVGLETISVVERDNQGQTIVHQYKLLPDSLNRPEGKVLETFTCALFGDSDDGILQLADAGLDEIFLQDVAGALQLEKSALVIYIRRDRLVDTRRLLDALGLLQGKIHHVCFPDEVEDAIINLGCNNSSDNQLIEN
jgi:uncharacterized membrane protein